MTSHPVPSARVSADEACTGAGSSSLEHLKKRADFLRAARAKRIVTPGFILQVRGRPDRDGPIRVGFTCSKKVGNAVARNRAKRRLREIARCVLPQKGRPGTDYVLIGRAQITASRPFDLMLSDLLTALEQAQ